MNNYKRSISLFLLCVLLLGMLAGCGTSTDNRQQTIESLENATLGIVTGTNWDVVAQTRFPNAQRKYFSSVSDVLLALEQGKVDAFLADNSVYAAMRWENANITTIDEPIESISNALILSKEAHDQVLLEQINAFVARCKADGTLTALEEKWFGEEEPTEHPDYRSLSGENGTLQVAVGDSMRPTAYQHGDFYTGYEVDFLTRFAQAYGYKLELHAMAFEALIPSVASGKCDIGACGITVTPERAESVLFADPHFEAYGVAVIRRETSAQETEATLEDYATAKMGIITGSSHDLTAKRIFPDAQRVYFKAIPDMVLAVEQGKLDCYMEDAPFLVAAIWEGANVKRLGEPVAQMRNGFVFPQSEDSRPLREEVNAFLQEAKSDGTVDRLLAKWMADTEPTEHPDYQSLSGENGTIHLAVSVDSKPLLYKNKDGCTGFEMELLTIFARQHGYALDIEEVPFESVLAGIAAEKYDMAASTLNITPEREESVDFSDPYATIDVVLVVKGDADESTVSAPVLSDFEHATLGVHTGTVYETYAKERFPEAERVYYTIMSDMILALEQGKIDGYLSERPYVAAAIWEGAKITAVEEGIAQTNAGYIFPKGDASAQLREQLNAFIRKAREEGLLDQLAAKWFGDTEPTQPLDYDALTGENGTIRVAVAPDLKPSTYVKDGQLTGYDIELLVLFAKEYGYQLDMSYMTFDAILAGITTGKYDLGTGAVTITEERAQSVDFSESHLSADVVMVVAAEDAATARTSFWDELKSDFEKTFIREDRWKLIVEGIGVTMLISICAAIAGTLLGFGLYMLGRCDVRLLQRLAKGIARVYSRIVAGTPVVVILMILFYVIFGKIRDISGILVAIIGFSLTFGAFVCDHMEVSVDSVDLGQTEAAYALGYTKRMTFFRIIFPQAMTIFLPSYCSQVVELVKATAVVGYIAVNDLTKMGDIIRSNTYEAFFPLIATAVIYFLLTWILSALLQLIRIRFEPKRRKDETVLKGVKTV